MKRFCCIALLLFLLVVPARAAEVPSDLQNALPNGTEELLKDADFSGTTGLADGLAGIFRNMGNKVREILRERVRGAVSILLVVLLCGVVDGFSRSAGGSPAVTNYLPMVGALSITMLTAGSLDSLIGLGAETIDSLSQFSKVLLPTLAAATAAGGAISTASVQQVTTVFFVDLLLNLIDGLLMPLVYLYIGALTAGAMLPGNRLGGIAEAMKKIITWVLSASLLIFTVYLSVVHIIAGSADSLTVKVAKTAISGTIPVVGGIISEATETVLAGAGMLKNTIGIFGTLAVLAACAYPFLQLGIQYILYKLTAFLAGTVGAPELCKLIDGLGGAFGLVLGMTGSCALLILISVLSSVAAVVP